VNSNPYRINQGNKSSTALMAERITKKARTRRHHHRERVSTAKPTSTMSYLSQEKTRASLSSKGSFFFLFCV
jgi:hypothetical protein